MSNHKRFMRQMVGDDGEFIYPIDDYLDDVNRYANPIHIIEPHLSGDEYWDYLEKTYDNQSLNGTELVIIGSVIVTFLVAMVLVYYSL